MPGHPVERVGPEARLEARIPAAGVQGPMTGASGPDRATSGRPKDVPTAKIAAAVPMTVPIRIPGESPVRARGFAGPASARAPGLTIVAATR
jgi:hypothetical protein